MSEWILHVKSVAAKKKISYKEAMKVAKETYKPKGKAKADKKAPVKKAPVKKAPVKKVKKDEMKEE